ncbi:hypothetical protein Q3G72_015184 [Acer saccharum]|nr:hypothetical protein Q3G72_015184 [Acer saccharum]
MEVLSKIKLEVGLGGFSSEMKGGFGCSGEGWSSTGGEMEGVGQAGSRWLDMEWVTPVLVRVINGGEARSPDKVFLLMFMGLGKTFGSLTMGCICSKATRAHQYVEENNNVKEKESTTKISKKLPSFKKDNVAVLVEADGGGTDATARLIHNQPVDGSAGLGTGSSDEGEKKEKPILQRRGTMDVGITGAHVGQPRMTRITSVSNGERGAQVVAGWPSWLTAVAGEAINGWVPRKADSFEKLDKIGQGTYSNYGASVDLWSSGCILAELFAGKPIMPGRTEVEQLHKIFKLCGSPSEEYWKRSKLPHSTIFKPQQPYKRCVAETFKDFPSSALSLLDALLATEPEGRGTSSSALQSEFFTTNPLPCDPSSLPKYPPSKEFDVKLRDEDARRQKAAGGKGRGHDSIRKASRESKAVPAPDANAELPESMQKRQKQTNPTSNSENYNPEEDADSSFPKAQARNVYFNSGQLMHPSRSSPNMAMDDDTFRGRNGAFGSPRGAAELRKQRSNMHPGAGGLNRFSNSVAVRGNTHSQLDCSTGIRGNPRWHEDAVGKHDWSQHLLGRPKLSHKKGEQPSGKQSTVNRIHYSGPLLPPGGNLEEMLKEHERQIQNAVRKARLDKTKIQQNDGGNGQTQSLLNYGTNGR